MPGTYGLLLLFLPVPPPQMLQWPQSKMFTIITWAGVGTSLNHQQWTKIKIHCTLLLFQNFDASFWPPSPTPNPVCKELKHYIWWIANILLHLKCRIPMKQRDVGFLNRSRSSKQQKKMQDSFSSSLLLLLLLLLSCFSLSDSVRPRRGQPTRLLCP